jgi:hypothetical protein
MTRYIFGLMLLCGLVAAAARKPPAGHGEDDSVSIDATILTPEQVKDAVGSDFGGVYTVLEMKISPKGAKPYEIHPDDFILRSEATGDHSGPMLAGQVASSGAMVVERKYGARSNPEMPQVVQSMKVEMKENDGKGGDVELVKKKMLQDQSTTQPQSGLLFFPLEKQKPKSLVLSCTTPSGKLRIQFR